VELQKESGEYLHVEFAEFVESINGCIIQELWNTLQTHEAMNYFLLQRSIGCVKQWYKTKMPADIRESFVTKLTMWHSLHPHNPKTREIITAPQNFCRADDSVTLDDSIIGSTAISWYLFSHLWFKRWLQQQHANYTVRTVMQECTLKVRSCCTISYRTTA
jgi:hypothetical protein